MLEVTIEGTSSYSSFTVNYLSQLCLRFTYKVKDDELRNLIDIAIANVTSNVNAVLTPYLRCT